ncbi:Endonuclease/exonuclease/phosphatase, partial [Mycena alexandri]
NTKAFVKIDGLNIRGNGNVNINHTDNKWFRVNQTMSERRLGILIVGEAHLSDERLQDIERVFARQLKVVFSRDPRTPNANGVAFVLNKNLVKTDDIKTTEIIPGRALLLETKKKNDKPLSILGVYAPNSAAENEEFWKEIQAFFETHRNVRRPDVMGGDTNVVEDALDRLPAHSDPDGPVSALDELKSFLRLTDGWRETHPTTRAYTYHQVQTGSQSRIDRIYVKRDVFEQTYEWDISTVGIKTDHRLVSMKLTSEDTPTIGHGRWVWPTHLHKDKDLKKFIHEKGLALQTELAALERSGNRRNDHNVQTTWKTFKDEIIEKARERAKIVIPKIDKEIKELEAELDIILAQDLPDEERKLSGAILTEKLAKLHQKRSRDARESSEIRNRLYGETISRYWSLINKER